MKIRKLSRIYYILAIIILVSSLIMIILDLMHGTFKNSNDWLFILVGLLVLYFGKDAEKREKQNAANEENKESEEVKSEDIKK